MSDLRTLGIIGVGNMGTALLNGILGSNILKPEQTFIYDINEEVLENRKKEFIVYHGKNVFIINLKEIGTGKYGLRIYYKKDLIDYRILEISQ